MQKLDTTVSSTEAANLVAAMMDSETRQAPPDRLELWKSSLPPAPDLEPAENCRAS